MTVAPDETPATCACGDRTYQPDTERWQMDDDGWWCTGCLREATQ